MLDELCELARQLCSRQNDIHQSCSESGARHAVILSILWLLDHYYPPDFFNIFDSDRAICATTGEDDRNWVGVTTGGHAAEKMIDRCTVAVRLIEFSYVQARIRHQDVAIGRNDVYMVRFDFGCLCYL